MVTHYKENTGLTKLHLLALHCPTERQAQLTDLLRAHNMDKTNRKIFELLVTDMGATGTTDELVTTVTSEAF